MYTKILFYDDDGDLAFDYAHNAYRCTNGDDAGVMISISDDCAIWVRNLFPDTIIRKLYEQDSVDLTSYGNVVWIDEEDNWSDDDDAADEGSFED